MHRPSAVDSQRWRDATLNMPLFKRLFGDSKSRAYIDLTREVVS
jgi:hypothetical protein